MRVAGAVGDPARFGFLFWTIVLVIAGCASTRQAYAPDGRKAYTLNCTGMARGWDKCYSAAGNICGSRGYDITDRTGEDAEVGAASGNGNSFSSFHGRTQERSMVIACKNPAQVTR